MSGEILFLAHRMPFPPDRGDKIRSFHVLKALSAIAPVHVATFAETGADMRHELDLATECASLCLARRGKPLALAGAEAMLRGEAVSLAAFRDPAIGRFVKRCIATRPIEAIYVFSGQMGQYVPEDYRGRVVIDLVDVDSAKFEAYAAEGTWPRSWVDAREGRLLRLEEARLAALADETLLVSDAEADLLRSRLPLGGGAKVSSLRNGIDTALFDPAAVEPHSGLVGSEGPHIVFTGQMDYMPNVAAAVRAVESIVPAIRHRFPATRLHIVGRNPTRQLLAHDGRDGVKIWGEVPDVRPFLAAADVVLAPLSIARGVQNKVLEAMAMARPVVLTSGASAGIGAKNDKHFKVVDEDAGLAAAAVELYANHRAAQAMGQAAREFVVETMGWSAMLARLPSLIGIEPSGEGARNAA